ncbi:tail assembly protein [Streptococcus phage Javan174]|uniref:phage tail spike protein n=1 Tax=Streptococcus entericus TaxID=155680 RepID=UPI00036D3117|nr:phage tail spike protein [Streptococcus entericus]QBX24119.1 tail assembly protein [Streptococcus phage Javan174]
MLLTIHDANLQKVAFVDNDKQSTLNYYDDTWARQLETGSSTFEFTVYKKAIKSDTATQKTYNYLNEKAFVSFKYNGKSFLFSVMTVEEDEQTITCYCENLNLELINEYSNPYKATKAMSFVEYCNAMDLLNFTHLTVGINEISNQKRTLEWEGQETKLARLLSLAKKFDAEIDFETHLNDDSTIKSFKVNVYHENDDTHQGVGRVRNDIQLTYGKNLKSITRKIDKSDLYTMVRPYGKRTVKNAKGEEVEEIVTINSLSPYSENNSDGVREFYQSGEALYAPIAAQMYPSTFTHSTQADQWIRKDLEVDSDNPTVIRAAGLRNLKKHAYPAITYTVDGFLDVEIGDTVRIYDDGFSPLLLVQARVSDQKISFTNPTRNSTTFANFKALENRLSDDIQTAFERLFEASKPYLIKLSTTNGVIFKNQIGESLITPSLYRGGKPVVSGVTWRWSLDGQVKTGMTYLVRGRDVVDTVTLTVAAYIGNDEVAVDEISFVNVVDGKLGTPGTPGRDGRTPYVHTAWANNATGTDGFSLDSSINKLYIGIYTDFEPADSEDPTRYKWTKTKGEQGDNGEKGDTGNGISNVTNYYLATTASTGITRASAGWTTTPQAITADKRYLWNYRVELYTDGTTKMTDPAIIGVHGEKGERGLQGIQGVQGVRGEQGIPGAKGADGRTQYTHIAYADNATGGGFSQTDQTKAYIGMYQDFNATDSPNPTMYHWTKWKGTDGANGVPGAKGADGRTPYIHFAYAESADGRTGFSTTQTGNKRYLGTYTDYTQADSADPTRYNWVDMVGTVEVDHVNLVENSKIDKSSNGYGFESRYVELVAGKTYYFLARAKKTGGVSDKRTRVYLYKTDWQENYNLEFNSTNYETKSIKFTARYTERYAISTYWFPGGGDRSGTADIDWYMVVESNIEPKHWSPHPNDVTVALNTKADQTLTQEQLNALAEKAQVHEAELAAKASMEAFSDLEKAYNVFVKANGEAAKKSEADLIEAGRRIDLLTTQFGGLRELKTFIDTYMTSSNEGLVIGKNDASSTIKVSHDRISMFSAGKEVMYISQGVIHIDNGIFTASVQIGRFRTEQYHLNADMNVIRYVG